MFGDLHHGSSYAQVPLEKEQDKPVSQRTSEDTAQEESGLLVPQFIKTKRRYSAGRVKVVVGTCVLLTSFIATFVLGLHYRPSLDRVCLEHTSTYSPVLELMDPSYKMVKFNGTLGYLNEYTGNYGDPSPEVDAAWEKWSWVKVASISEEDFRKMPGANLDSARLTPEYGGGFIGYLEVSHHMHCLNLLRKGIHKDYYDDLEHPEHRAAEFGDRPWTVKLHLAHCIEMLRQNIMCNADVGLISHEWIVQSPDPFANFNTWHKCRDIDTVEKWIEDHQIPTPPDGSDLPIPLDAKIYPTPP